MIAALLLAVAGPPAGLEDSDSPTIERAQALYEQGSARYDAADYAGAIDAFTEALSVVQQLPDPADSVRLSLLYNIASAHERAYEIDQDEAHLHQALELYERYRDFADEIGDLKEQLDVGAKVARLRRMLKELEEPEPGPETATPPTAPPRHDASEWKRPRNVGTGLVVAGGAATVGGVVLAVLGSRYEQRARDQVNELADMGVPADHPAWEEGDDFIAQETRKGRILMGVGASVAIVGGVAAGTGVYYLVKAKRVREGQVSVTPTLGAGFAGVQVRARF